MWTHYCKTEKCLVSVEKGQSCNWCGYTEYENKQTLENNDEFVVKQGLSSEGMNSTNFEHAGYALLMQLCIGLITGDWLAGATFGVAFFLGREHAQAQNKYQLGDFAAFDIRKWNLDAKLDLIFPTVAVLLAALIIERV